MYECLYTNHQHSLLGKSNCAFFIPPVDAQPIMQAALRRACAADHRRLGAVTHPRRLLLIRSDTTRVWRDDERTPAPVDVARASSWLRACSFVGSSHMGTRNIIFCCTCRKSSRECTARVSPGYPAQYKRTRSSGIGVAGCTAYGTAYGTEYGTASPAQRLSLCRDCGGGRPSNLSSITQ